MKAPFFAIPLLLSACAAPQQAAPFVPGQAGASRVAQAVQLLAHAPKGCTPLGFIESMSRRTPANTRRRAAEIELRERAANRGANVVNITNQEYGPDYVTVAGQAYRCPSAS